MLLTLSGSALLRVTTVDCDRGQCTALSRTVFGEHRQSFAVEGRPVVSFGKTKARFFDETTVFDGEPVQTLDEFIESLRKQAADAAPAVPRRPLTRTLARRTIDPPIRISSLGSIYVRGDTRFTVVGDLCVLTAAAANIAIVLLALILLARSGRRARAGRGGFDPHSVRVTAHPDPRSAQEAITSAPTNPSWLRRRPRPPGGYVVESGERGPVFRWARSPATVRAAFAARIARHDRIWHGVELGGACLAVQVGTTPGTTDSVPNVPAPSPAGKVARNDGVWAALFDGPVDPLLRTSEQTLDGTLTVDFSATSSRLVVQRSTVKLQSSWPLIVTLLLFGPLALAWPSTSWPPTIVGAAFFLVPVVLAARAEPPKVWASEPRAERVNLPDDLRSARMRAVTFYPDTELIERLTMIGATRVGPREFVEKALPDGEIVPPVPAPSSLPTRAERWQIDLGQSFPGLAVDGANRIRLVRPWGEVWAEVTLQVIRDSEGGPDTHRFDVRFGSSWTSGAAAIPPLEEVLVAGTREFLWFRWLQRANAVFNDPPGFGGHFRYRRDVVATVPSPAVGVRAVLEVACAIGEHLVSSSRDSLHP